jgi:hypothetical protein
MIQIPRSPLVRILLVEDFEPFRRFIRSQLQPRLDLEVIAEASDGSSTRSRTRKRKSARSPARTNEGAAGSVGAR